MTISSQTTGYTILRVREGREWSLRQGHPWLFSRALFDPPAAVRAGEVVDLFDTKDQFLGRGYYNPKTDIAVRILSRSRKHKIDRDFIERRLRSALELRQQTINLDHTDTYRLVNAEGDHLPGLIVDKFGPVLVIQSHTAGMDRLLSYVTEALKEILAPQCIIWRNDAGIRSREGLNIEPPQIVYGTLPEPLLIRENDIQYSLDVLTGQKTGFFIDQRDKRLRFAQIAKHLPPGSTFLNVFSYSASFSLAALKMNADLHTINVDQSDAALETARRSYALNDRAGEQHEFHQADAFTWLQDKVNNKEHFDLIVLDPPAFAKSIKDKARAVKGYTRLASLGFSLAKPGSFVLMCSCSGAVSLSEFEQAIREGATRANTAVQVVEVLQHGADHPVNLFTPELSYLKVLLCRVN